MALQLAFTHLLLLAHLVSKQVCNRVSNQRAGMHSCIQLASMCAFMYPISIHMGY